MFRSERIRRVVLLKSFCFWGCVFRSERIRRVVLCVQILLFLGLCVFRSERIRRVVLCVQILLFLGLCVFRSERIRRVVLRCSNPSVSGVVCLGRREYVELCCGVQILFLGLCVCLGRREYVELCCGAQILLCLGLCVFRSERIRRVVLRCSNPSVSGVVCVCV